LCEAIKRKRPGRLTAGVRLLRPHTSVQTVAWLQNWKWEVLQHPPHSPNLVPSDFYLFGPFKNFVSGKRFLRTKMHCKKQLCNTSHHLERNITVEKCLNLYSGGINVWMLTMTTWKNKH
jgi:hypothetical protein